jgi:hypothetical protein
VAAISFAGGTALNIAAGASDEVILRNLTLNGGGSGVAGITFTTGAWLTLSNVTVMNSGPGGPGLQFLPSAASQLVVQDARFLNNGGGILIAPGSGGSAKVSLLRTRLDGSSGYGLRADSTTTGSGSVNVEFAMSEAAHNAGNGIEAVAGAASVTVVIKRSSLLHNGANGLQSTGTNSFVLADASTIVGNSAAAASVEGGGTYTYQTNAVAGNLTSNGAFTATLPAQ